MIRREFLLAVPLWLVSLKYKEFVFKIRTKRGSVLYATIQGKDLYAAQAKLMQRYPGCTVLSAREKKD